MATSNKPPRASWAQRAWHNGLPGAVMLLALMLLWYGAACAINSTAAI